MWQQNNNTIIESMNRSFWSLSIYFITVAFVVYNTTHLPLFCGALLADTRRVLQVQILQTISPELTLPHNSKEHLKKYADDVDKAGLLLRPNPKPNQSRFQGVGPLGSKWGASFKKKRLGSFDSEEAAARAVLEASKLIT
jgi:hypothetical protein